MPADNCRTAIVRLYGGNCFSSRFVRNRGVCVPVKFCGRGGEASDIFCAALSLSHLRCQLSPGGSLGLSVLFVRCVTVHLRISIICKVDMFDSPCKSNSICKGSAFARYIRLATDAICFSCGKTCCSHQIRYSVPGTHSFLFLYSLRKGATSRLSSQHTQLSHPSTV